MSHKNKATRNSGKRQANDVPFVGSDFGPAVTINGEEMEFKNAVAAMDAVTKEEQVLGDLKLSDEIRTCVDCGAQFALPAKEQAYIITMFGMQSANPFNCLPKRCKKCRNDRKAMKQAEAGTATPEPYVAKTVEDIQSNLQPVRMSSVLSADEARAEYQRKVRQPIEARQAAFKKAVEELKAMVENSRATTAQFMKEAEQFKANWETKCQAQQDAVPVVRLDELGHALINEGPQYDELIAQAQRRLPGYAAALREQKAKRMAWLKNELIKEQRAHEHALTVIRQSWIKRGEELRARIPEQEAVTAQLQTKKVGGLTLAELRMAEQQGAERIAEHKTYKEARVVEPIWMREKRYGWFMGTDEQWATLNNLPDEVAIPYEDDLMLAEEDWAWEVEAQVREYQEQQLSVLEKNVAIFGRAELWRLDYERIAIRALDSDNVATLEGIVNELKSAHEKRKAQLAGGPNKEFQADQGSYEDAAQAVEAAFRALRIKGSRKSFKY